jgi:hypothetical protein
VEWTAEWVDERLEWMCGRLERFRAICEAYGADQRARRYEGYDRRLYTEVARQQPTVRRIVEELDPALADFDALSPMGGWSRAACNVTAALGMLADLDDVRTYLRRRGPAVDSEAFHPRIWQAAAACWDAGQHPAAVVRAAESLTHYLQRRGGLLLVGRELAAEVFSAEDVAGRTRLWLPGDRAGAAWRSRQDGLRLMAEAALAGIEHVAAAGEKPGCSRQEALEYLAVLSTVARWTDETETHRL